MYILILYELLLIIFKSVNTQLKIYVKREVQIGLIHFSDECIHLLCKFNRIYFLLFYLFIFREGEGKGKERNTSVWLPLEHPLVGTWPKTQALAGNQTGDLWFAGRHSIQ